MANTSIPKNKRGAAPASAPVPQNTAKLACLLLPLVAAFIKQHGSRLNSRRFAKP